MHIGLIIKKLMLQENVELPELAKKLGKSKQAIYDMLEKEDLNTSLLKDLSSIFNVPITVFFEEGTTEQISKGDSNIVLGRDNAGSITSNKNNINIELPESGTQKIIRPDGTVEILKSETSIEELQCLQIENEGLEQRIKDLQKLVDAKDDIIASKDETIVVLKHRLDI